jgi:hypothetical protein
MTQQPTVFGGTGAHRERVAIRLETRPMDELHGIWRTFGVPTGKTFGVPTGKEDKSGIPFLNESGNAICVRNGCLW